MSKNVSSFEIQKYIHDLQKMKSALEEDEKGNNN